MTHNMKKALLAALLVELYEDYSNALIQAENDGKVHYSDEDFNSLENFISFIKNNYPI